MKTVPIILGVLIAIAGLTLVVIRSRSHRRAIDGLSSHRRHMDALSSEARREVIDRLQRNQGDDGGDDIGRPMGGER